MLDPQDDQPAVETDERFPSGPWTGFFIQPDSPRRHRMELELAFRDGRLRGDGNDWVGEFIVRGRYQTSDGSCWWTKAYIGQHDVAYSGHNERQGIWGKWEIRGLWSGGFHIWPLAMGDPYEERAAEELEEPTGTSVGGVGAGAAPTVLGPTTSGVGG